MEFGVGGNIPEYRGKTAQNKRPVEKPFLGEGATAGPERKRGLFRVTLRQSGRVVKNDKQKGKGDGRGKIRRNFIY